MGVCCASKAKKYSQEDIGNIMAKSLHDVDFETEDIRAMFSDSHHLGVTSMMVQMGRGFTNLIKQTQMKDGELEKVDSIKGTHTRVFFQADNHELNYYLEGKEEKVLLGSLNLDLY